MISNQHHVYRTFPRKKLGLRLRLRMRMRQQRIYTEKVFADLITAAINPASLG